MNASIKRTLKAVLLSSTLLAMTASLASAETVIRRGNGGEPQTLDQALRGLALSPQAAVDQHVGPQSARRHVPAR
ncbi:MAG: hypothetical protein QMD99_08800, partial [Rhizobiaceae bacterium]|nr:hypothetical protein [Rhizobiaceae bacterium]